MKVRTIRRLARGARNQAIYARAKEIKLRLFVNEVNFSNIQVQYLYWLEIYSSLYLDLAMDKIHISEDVIVDDIRVDAYLLWRKKENQKQKRERMNPRKDKRKDKVPAPDTPSIIFRRK